MSQATNGTTFYSGADLDRKARAVASDYRLSARADGVRGTIHLKQWRLLVGSRVLGGQVEPCIVVQIALAGPGRPGHTVSRYVNL